SVDGGRNFGANAPGFDDGRPVRGGFISALAVDQGWNRVLRVEDATPAEPIVVTAHAHGFATGDQVSIRGVETNRAAHGRGTVDGPRHAAPKAIAAAANVAGGVELTAAGHGLVDGDRVSVDGLPGVAAPANTGTVRRISDDVFLVAGLHMNAAFGGGATVAG